MNKEAIYEIGKIIHVLRSWTFRKLEAKEIIDSYEYKFFKKKYPEICKMVEENEHKSTRTKRHRRS